MMGLLIRKIFPLFCLLALAWVSSTGAWMNLSVSGSGVPAAAGFCASQSWNTLTDFSVDFDHTTDNKQACYDASDGEVGVLNNGATIATPPTVSPVSGGDAVLANGDSRYIDFDNDTPYFNSQYGEIYFTVYLAGNNTGADYFLYISHDGNNKLNFQISSTGAFYVVWEDNSGGNASTTGGPDFDDYYGDWLQFHVKWDTTRCQDAGDTCDGGAADEELGFRYRIDDNRDGDFDDGGVEDWSAFIYEQSALRFDAWAAEPGDGDIKAGLTTATYSENIYVDDLEISKSQPSW
jgi:hypothetical protein